MNSLNIDLDKMYDKDLSIDQVFILYALYYKLDSYVKKYITLHGPVFDKDRILKLYKRGFIKIKFLSHISFNHLSITDEGRMIIEYVCEIHNITISEEDLIKELSGTYPKKAGIRKGLQANKDAWSKKYIKLIRKDPSLRETIIKCIKEEVDYRTKTNQMDFMPMLSTYINQKRWETVEEELKEKESKDVKRNSEKEVYGGKIF